jgi:hypothetical protein
LSLHSIPRRPSSGAQHYGRGGAANVFKPEDVVAPQNESAIDDSASSHHRKSLEQLENLAARGKAMLFGKK